MGGAGGGCRATGVRIRQRRTAQARQAGTLPLMVGRYWLTVAPQVRRELDRWARHARAIPNPVLRAHALRKLRDEHLNAEAAATFATLAVRAQQATVVRLMVAYQVMYDYLDALSEQPADDPLENGRQLHAALVAALEPKPVAEDFYKAHPRREDGGYLQALVTACKTMFVRLPAATTVRPIAREAAREIGEAQTRAHAVRFNGVDQLREWSLSQSGGSAFHWWEWAAGASASLSVHALFAAATEPRTTQIEAQRIHAAYTPAICALATLLDSLADQPRDKAGTDHSFIGYYPSADLARTRLVEITRCALALAAGLRHGHRHSIIVAGIACFYLSVAGPTTATRAAVTGCLFDEIGIVARPTFHHWRVWRRLRHKSGPGSGGAAQH